MTRAMRRASLAGALVAALLAGCGSDSGAELNGGSGLQRPTTPVEHTGTPTSLPDVAPDPDATPASDVVPEAESEQTRAYDAAPEPELAAEAESDADRWVDRRQDQVLDDVHENNLDAIEGWSP